MSQPFDNRDWDLRRIAALEQEIARLKTQHQELLLKGAREQGVALQTLEGALEEIARLKALLAERDCCPG